MKTIILVFFLAINLPMTGAHAQSAKSWTAEQQQVIDAMDRLSQATAVDGGGAADYAAVLTENFSRWSSGSQLVNDKKTWVDGLDDWFTDGWRVTDRSTQIVGIVIQANHAFVRRNVQETYLGPENNQSEANAALAEVWVRDVDQWKLMQANVTVIDQL